ncbi:hypothetical protein FYK30_10430 [Escherichia albertii]|nr:hypothetical protein FYK30_10430 [Escherichia albertii]
MFFVHESELIDEFCPVKKIIPQIVRRNFSIKYKRLHFGAGRWTPAILKDKIFDVTYIYHSGPFTAKAIRNNSNKIILREDGLSNYVIHPLHPLKRIARFFCFLSPFGQVWGEERWINSIEVESPNLLPNRIKHKAKKLSINALLDGLNDACKKLLIDSFELDDIFLSDNFQTCLILTQPIDDFGACSTEQKKSIYSKIAQKFIDKGFKVFVKFHPKEEIYTLPVTHFIPKDFPVELLQYILHKKFDYCIALCSTSLSFSNNAIALNQIQIIPVEKFNPDSFKYWYKLVEDFQIEDRA